MKKQLLSLIAAGALLSGMQLFAAPQVPQSPDNTNTPRLIRPERFFVFGGRNCENLKKLFPFLPARDCRNDPRFLEEHPVTAARLYKWLTQVIGLDKRSACTIISRFSYGASAKAFCP